MLLERVQQELLLVQWVMWHLQEVLTNLRHRHLHHLKLQVLLVLLEWQLAIIIHLKLVTTTILVETQAQSPQLEQVVGEVQV